MYAPNTVVQQNNIMGRVICHDPIQRKVHVLVRVNEYTWFLQKWDDFQCQISYSLLWHMETPFASKCNNCYRTPNLDPMDIDQEVHVMYLNQ